MMGWPLLAALLAARVAGAAQTPPAPHLDGQSRASQLVDSARVQVAANHLDSAAALLRAALDTALHAAPAERQNALVWDGIVHFFRGEPELARSAFRQALALDSALDVKGLERLSPELAQFFQQEKNATPWRRAVYYVSGSVDESPRRLSGPPVDYPRSLLRRHVQGFVQVAAIIDTAGRAERASVEVLSTPDSGLNEPVKQMMLASQFSPGRLKGTAVRVMVQMGVDVLLPRLRATELVGSARAQLAARRPDSALTLLEFALDSALTHPTDGERAYALLVRGVAASRAGRDSAGRIDLGEGLALYQSLTARGVDLAPFLRRLADSVRLARRGSNAPGPAMSAPTAAEPVDEQPVLVSHPPIRYPPEMQALRVEGTVVVEAGLDTTGRVEHASAKIAASPNHAFDGEALRVVRGSVYRPARRQGRAVRAVIRQAITFVNY
jgi:TonB family protein